MALRVFEKIQTIHKYFAATTVAAIAGVGLFIWAVHIDTPTPQVMQAVVDCTPSAQLVNPCRPWLGAAVGGYTMVAADSNTQFNFFNKRLNDSSVLNDPSKAVTLTKTMDMPHVYLQQGSNLFSASVQTVLNNSAFPQIMVNWKPLPNGYTWSDAAGGNTTVDDYIRAGANNVKALGSRKIILAVWHEPEDDVSVGNCASNASGASMGSPAEYVQMWHNVRNIFDQQGVTNVVWAMNYMGYSKWDCLIPQLWPGNSYVDWVVYDPYASGTMTFDTSVGRFYDVLTNNSNSTYNYLSKPWGLAEHGYGNPNGTSTESGAVDYWNQAKAAIQTNKYPNIKMWLVFDTSVNGESQVGLKFDKTTIQTAEQDAYNGFADAIFAMQGTGGGTPPPPTGDTVQPDVSFATPTNGATVNKTVTVTANATDNVGVVRVQLHVDSTLIKDDKDGSDGWTTRWDSTKVSDGAHTLKATAYDAAGNMRITTIAITVANGGTPSGSGSTPAPTSTEPAPVVQTLAGKPVANAAAGGTVRQGDLLVLDSIVLTDPEKIKMIAKVEFYEGDTLLQTVTEEPFALDTKNLKPGTYTLRQVTYFDDGNTVEASQTVTIEGKPVLAKKRKTWATWVTGVVIGTLLLGGGSYFGARYLICKGLLRHFPRLPLHKPGAVDLPKEPATPQIVQPTGDQDRHQ